MCGICGFTGKRDDELLHRMTDTIKHRGPMRFMIPLG
jgi:asparagine synthetase B (glutamine-hydrolysing)